MQCPRDANELEYVTINHKSYHRCKLCAGLFFPLMKTTLSGVKVEDLKPKTSACIANGVGVLESPASKSVMQRFAYKGVHLDYCAAVNAVWIDGGELETLAANVATTHGAPENDQAADGSDSSWVVVDAVELGLEVTLDFVLGAISSVFD